MDKLLESDPELASFVEQMEQSQRLQKVAEKLTNDCWDLCVSSPGVSKFDYKTESCLANCVERFLDTSMFVANSMANRAQSSSSGFSAPSGGFTDSEMILEDKFSLGAETGKTNEEAKTKSGFKFW